MSRAVLAAMVATDLALAQAQIERLRAELARVTAERDKARAAVGDVEERDDDDEDGEP